MYNRRRNAITLKQRTFIQVACHHLHMCTHRASEEKEQVGATVLVYKVYMQETDSWSARQGTHEVNLL